MVLKIQSSSIEVVKTDSLPVLRKKEAVRELMSSTGQTTQEPCSSLLLVEGRCSCEHHPENTDSVTLRI